MKKYCLIICLIKFNIIILAPKILVKIMAEYFSFIEQQIVNILKISGLLIPGIEKVIAIYYDHKLDDIYAKSLKQNSFGTKINDYLINDSNKTIEKLRTKKEPFNWYKKGELPFEIKDANKVIMEIFSELENVVLLMRFFNENDKNYDLLFFYFNENAGNFEICKSNKSLSVKNKNIIEFILYNNIKTTIETNRQDLIIFQLFMENRDSIVKDNEQMKEKIIILENSKVQILGDICKAYVTELSDQKNKDFKLSENALKKIGDYDGDINNLKSIMERAISCIENINFENDNEFFMINAWDINFFDFDLKTKPDENKLPTLDKYTKTELLLDKLEKAAQEAKSNNFSLTSANVGKLLPTPITAPAISDALKKHKKTILYLLKKYPDKWRIIRNEFRPLLNIITARPNLEDYYNSETGN